ncbi:cytochrome c-type biogenesis protein [Qipengyuania zhejiangensis]|uniref:cytochrome c-type biogenesis protein n=1 Tax=Qipengyuania zhejiangensis TaxID=3077782 RepID=UPI002D772CCB|nr:cytochrome c-type biogenesis protein [Qipengyuania sp. Z2]
MIRIIVASIALALSAPLAAQDTMPPAPYAYRQLDNPAQEQAAQELMETLRCLKCQSQSIADSDAPMAGDMRHQVRIRIAAGESPDSIRGWLMQRYGDYVSYKPEVSASTWPLFAIPILLILVAAGILFGRLRRRA